VGEHRIDRLGIVIEFGEPAAPHRR
jgi:hypothetical protein